MSGSICVHDDEQAPGARGAEGPPERADIALPSSIRLDGHSQEPAWVENLVDPEFVSGTNGWLHESNSTLFFYCSNPIQSIWNPSNFDSDLSMTFPEPNPPSNIQTHHSVSPSSSKRSGSEVQFEDLVQVAGAKKARRASSSGGGAGSQEQQSPLACPFLRHDLIKHRGCLHNKLPRIKDVKQHLERKHAQPKNYCARCSDIFRSSEARDEHVRQGTCEMKPKVTFDGISDEQMKELGKSLGRSRGKGDEEKWFQLWDSIFPEEQRPASAFQGSDLTELLPVYRKALWEVWTSKGLEFKKRVLSENGLAGQTDYEPSLLDGIVRALLDEMEREVACLLA
ncbi:hypothetical protein M406DRAFT_70985 [Cryphonectria parasitica EP155]|uniref:C2H2-type domain-containing protein n=1 Tax=Cryphonectria parasitica (strain ATCC 38755 / EP155) TaxID=660469 RepID=A0A9P5CMK0_CRYP1|nr:uncharacterized protein M406DRAFT_70985 [Cryphonectria parasitica EP155]KAF3764479.1 hypothetical protein M406DRAFT_70985 [Cryphonectria parasitica EP155]